MGRALLELKYYFTASLLWNLYNLSWQMELQRFYLFIFSNSLDDILE